MADLVIDPTLVEVVSGAPFVYDAVVDIEAGIPCVLDGNTWKKADATALLGNYGISVNNAYAGQPLSVLTTGVIDLGVAVSQGFLYVVSPTGGIDLISALVATNFTNILGYGSDTANQLIIKRYNVPLALV